MKKCLALLFACVFVGSMASAQYLVYDYKANIKGLKDTVSVIKYSADEFDLKADTSAKLDSFSVGSESLKGFLVVPACASCDGYGTESFPFDTDYSYLYIMRTSDKAKNVGGFEPDAYAALFNKGVGVRPVDDARAESPTSMKNLKGASMELYIETDGYVGTDPAQKYFAWAILDYAKEVYLDMTGFGSAKVTTITGACSDSSCIAVSAISGTVTGYAYMGAACGEPPIWDVCSLELVTDSAISGTWSIKLNNKVSGEFSDTDDLLKHAYAVSKLGGKTLNHASIPANNNQNWPLAPAYIPPETAD